jgi:hypothetical protein
MPVNCGVCNAKCDADSIKCTGKCEKDFHFRCVNLSQEALKTRGSKKDWVCDQCKDVKSKVQPPAGNKPTSSAEVTKDFLLQTLQVFKNEISAEIKHNAKQFEEFKQALEFFSDKMDQSNKNIEIVMKNYAEMKKENLELKLKNEELSKEVKSMQLRMRNLEQYSRKNNVEIMGIPVTNNENIMDIVKDIGAAIKIEVRTDDVMAAHRVPAFQGGKESAIIVQLHTRVMRDDWLRGFKQCKGLTARIFPNTREYSVSVNI